MAAPTTPRIFLVNEQHELGPLKKGGGGKSVKLSVDWASKGAALRESLRTTLASEERLSPDPTVGEHHFLLARPDASLEYEGKKDGEPVIKKKQVELGGRESRLFRRFGIDLVGVADGAAIIHFTEATRARLDNELADFDELGERRRGEFAMLAEFAAIPLTERLDEAWFERESPGRQGDVVLELMPFLSGAEVDEVIAAVRKDLLQLDPSARWRRIGRDVSRRAWMRIALARGALPELLQRFPAIRRAHPPIFLEPAGRGARARPGPTTSPAAEWVVSRPPLVGIVDMGIPERHASLADYAAQRYRHPCSTAPASG